jgi:hypothetical protein
VATGYWFPYVRKEIQDSLKILFMDGHTAQLKNENAFEIRNDARRFELFEKTGPLRWDLGKPLNMH